MNSKALWLKNIFQKNNTAFTIEWGDGKIQTFLLCHLQRECPCARCTDENTGQKLVNPSTIPQELRARRINNVGRYGLRIDFLSGCSSGIYSYEMLRKLGELSHA